jgi:hypothetical protein
MTGKKPVELEELKELPEEFAECWSWFLRLNSKRTSNGFGMNSISYLEILALFDLINYRPHAWELEMIEAFDSVAMEYFSKQAERSKKTASKPKKK